MNGVAEKSIRQAERIVPIPLDLATPPPDALAMFRSWTAEFPVAARTENGWIPVGRVGPVVILGHPEPEFASAGGLPLWAFGLARIPNLTYRRLQPLVQAYIDIDHSQSPFPTTGLLQSCAQPPNSRRGAIEQMLHFPGAARDAASVATALANSSSEDDLLTGLPPGWREAALAISGALPLIDLAGFVPHPEVALLLPEAFAREHELVAVAIDGSNLVVASPTSPAGVRANYILSSWKAARDESAGGLRLALVLCPANSRADVERRIAARSKSTPTASPWGSTGGNRAAASTANIRTRLTLQKKEFERVTLETPHLDDRTLLRLALYRAIESGASDLHIDIESGAGRLRVRRDGLMRPLGGGRFGLSRLAPILQLLRINIDASGGDLAPVDGKFSLRSDEQFYDVRVSILPSPDSVTTGHGFAVLRFLPKDGGVRLLSDLQLANEQTAVLMETLDKPHGIVLVTGPTGSGKTTTLNAMIQQLNRGLRPGEEGALKILTAEDPVEYTIDGVQQINVSRQIPFAEAIRRFLRQDPDVILVGEIRDEETARAAIEAARTGHLVFSTLHTNGAAETISRLLGMKIPPYDLDGTLLTVIAQRLVPRLCTSCKIPRAPSAAEQRCFTQENLPVPPVIHDPSIAGCAHCDGGWRGRIPVLEIVKINPEVRKAIARMAGEYEMQQLCRDLGFRPLQQEALLKVALGDTSLAQALQLHAGWD